MPSQTDRDNAAKLKEEFGLEADTPIRVQYNTNEKVVYKEYGGGKDRSDEFTSSIRENIASGSTVEPDPSQRPENGKRSSMQVKALIDGEEKIIFRQEKDGTVTINEGYEQAIARSGAIDNEAGMRPPTPAIEAASSQPQVKETTPVTIEAPKKVGSVESVALESPKTIEVQKRPATANQTPEKGLDNLAAISEKLKSEASVAAQKALSNIASDARAARDKIRANASEKLNEAGAKAKAGLSIAKDMAVERAKADIKITQSAAKAKGAELGASAIAASRDKIQAALNMASKGTAAAKSAVENVEKRTQQASSWVNRITKTAHDRETARIASAKWEEGNARTGGNSFSMGDVTVSKEGDRIKVSQGDKNLVTATVDRRGNPTQIDSGKYDIDKIRAAANEPARGSETVENLYKAQSEAIAKMSRQAFIVQAGHVRSGETAKIPGKSYNYEMRSNGDFAVTRAKGGKEVLVQKNNGEIDSKLSKTDIDRFSRAAQALNAEQKQDAVATR